MKRFVKKGRRSNPNLFFNSMVLELAVIKKLAMNSKILTSTVENFNLSIWHLGLLDMCCYANTCICWTESSLQADSRHDFACLCRQSCKNKNMNQVYGHLSPWELSILQLYPYLIKLSNLLPSEHAKWTLADKLSVLNFYVDKTLMPQINIWHTHFGKTFSALQILNVRINFYQTTCTRNILHQIYAY